MKREEIIEIITTAQGIIEETIPSDDVLTSMELKQQHMLQRMMLLQQVIGMLDRPGSTAMALQAQPVPLTARGVSLDQENAVLALSRSLSVSSQEIRELVFEVGMSALAFQGRDWGDQFSALLSRYPLAVKIVKIVRAARS